MASREDLSVHLTAVDATAAAFNSFKRNLTGAASQLGAFAAAGGAALGPLAAGLSAVGIVAFSKEAVSSLGKIADEADRVSTTTDALQALQYQLKLGGGETADATAALTKFGDAASEAGLGGNYLTKVFEANKIALKDANGNLRTADALLVEYANLVANAATQQDKLMLATEAFGRKAGPKMVSTLEQIAQKGLPGVIAQAKEAGQVVDKEIVQRADEIDDKWNAALDSVTNKLKTLVVQAIEAGDAIGKAIEKGSKPAPMAGLMESSGLGLLTGGDMPNGAGGPISLPAGLRSTGPADLNDPLRRMRAASRTATVLPPKSDESDRNRTKEILENLRLEGDQLTLNLEKKREAERLQMQINMVQRAGVDATKEEQEQIRGAVDALFAKRLAYEESRRAQDALNDAVRLGGDMLVDSIEGLINKTKSWQDVLKDVLNSLTQAVLKAALLGEGPLAGLMGTKTQTGNVGGLLGSLFGLPGRAQGGPVTAGRAYVVNENTPNSEIFVPSADGMIVPRGSGGGAGGVTMIDRSTNNFNSAISGGDRAWVQSVVDQRVAASEGRTRKWVQSLNQRTA